jgi:hypothetical protein
MGSAATGAAASTGTTVCEVVWEAACSSASADESSVVDASSALVGLSPVVVSGFADCAGASVGPDCAGVVCAGVASVPGSCAAAGLGPNPKMAAKNERFNKDRITIPLLFIM